MKTFLVVALAALALSLLASDVKAWSYLDSSGPVWCTPAEYSLRTPGSADLGVATTETELQRGMDDWTREDCSGLRTSYLGRTSVGTASFDGNSVVEWVESGWSNSPIAIGVTTPQWSRRCITQADMEMNGVNYTWITGSGRGSSVNAYSIILHEGGHYMGLGHSSVSSAAMYGSYSGGVDSITADDRAGICTLYPGSGVSCETVPCPAGFECISGECEPMTGDGTLCSPCTDNAECGGPADLCIRFPDGLRYCTTACTSSADCGENSCFGTSAGGGQCAPVDSSGNAVCAGVMTGPECTDNSDCDATERCDSMGDCVPRPVDLGDLGEACETGDECNSGECIATPAGSICTEACDWLDATSCAPGFYCDGEALGTCGSGRCLAGTAGAGGLGDACGVDTECDSLFCVDGSCGLPCIPGGVADCPEGFSCLMGSLPLPSCGVCQRAGAVGDWCDRNEDCASLQCAERGDINFCTAFCSDATECPDSFTCEDAGGASVCAPPAGYVPPMMMTGPMTRDRGGCGCRVPGPERDLTVPLAAIFVLPALIWLRRRRKG
jgi:hypothetical protein